MLWFLGLCYSILVTRMAKVTSIPMPVELLLTIANELCYFTLPGRLFKRHLRYLIRHWNHLHGGAYCAEHALLSSEKLTI